MNKARILLVDDKIDILTSLGGVLSDEGHELFTAADGQEALHVVQSDAPDIVFLDVWIPGIDGMQTLKAIRKIDPDCSVIMMSGHGTIETAVKAIKLGADDYLEKPLNIEDVLHLVDKAMSRRHIRQRIAERRRYSTDDLIGISERTKALRAAVQEAASGDQNILLRGAKGVGKEFLARIIHSLSGKSRDNLVKVRCTDLTAQTFDDLFKDKKLNADGKRMGKLDQLRDGALLLIRIDRLQADLQQPLYDAVRAYFGPNTHNRVIATSTADISQRAAEGAFHPEAASFFAQRVVQAPTLSERKEDIPHLVGHFLDEACKEFDKKISDIDAEALAKLVEYSWPGNIKELKILIEHVVMTAIGPQLTAGDLVIPWGVHIAEATEEKKPNPSSLGIATGGSDSAESLRVSSQERGLYQKTLRGNVVIYGQGLHSGAKTGLILSPAPCSYGIRFGHITGAAVLQADLDNVDSTGYSTTLRSNGAPARTIEHLMAVFHVYGLSNVLVKISGEVPIMDGSALEFCNLVENAEIIVQDAKVEPIRITEALELPAEQCGPNKSLRIEPSDFLEIEYFMDYPHPIGKLHFHFICDGPEAFKKEIAPARTFGFVKDMRMMDEMGLAGGGRLTNVVLLDEEKVVNPPLRFPDEFVRHKVLDIVGDFYLLGRPFVGKIIAAQTGHTENIAMLRLLRRRLGL